MPLKDNSIRPHCAGDPKLGAQDGIIVFLAASLAGSYSILGINSKHLLLPRTHNLE
jgi:hypothetical protein